MPAVVMIGPQPPPIHGLSNVNLAVRRELEAEGFSLVVMDTAPRVAAAGLLRRLLGASRLALALGAFARRASKSVPTYMSVSGGLGRGADVAFAIVARLAGSRLYLHHHSFSYLDRYSLTAHALFGIAGSRCTHVTLSAGMAHALAARYASVARAIPISNAALLAQDLQDIVWPVGLVTIGFIGNITREKGITDVLDVASELRRRGLATRVRIAGPVPDVALEAEMSSRMADLPNCEYLGPVYDAAKTRFLASIDVLLFPTRYINEAEPLSIHEAMMFGVPVIAFGRGAIGEIVDETCGMVMRHDANFASTAAQAIEEWTNDVGCFARLRTNARARFISLRAANLERWHALMEELKQVPSGAD